MSKLLQIDWRVTALWSANFVPWIVFAAWWLR
jgi:hypothetical protein